MGSVLSYSGISTKIRAMSSHLVTDEQLQEIVRFSDVPQVAAYLKKTPEYAKAWSDLDENNLHRGEIEKLLKKSIFRISPAFTILQTRSSASSWHFIPSAMKSVF